VRYVLLLLLVSGCYAPQVTPGAPCDPLINNCPRELTCASGPGGFSCQRPGGAQATDATPDTSGDGAGPPGDAANDGPKGDAPTDVAQVTHLEYSSTVADCVDRVAPNPDGCITANGAGQLVLDADDSVTLNPWDGFARFDLDNQIAGRIVTSVKLRMTATSDAKAPSPDSGVVWKVQAFTRTSLATAEPAKVGNQPLAGSQGAVIKLQVVEWPLPTTTVTANQPVYLGLVSANADGVNYWNQSGANPPKLIIDLQ